MLMKLTPALVISPFLASLLLYGTYRYGFVHENVTKGAFTHPVSACVFRNGCNFLLLTLIEQNQGQLSVIKSRNSVR